MSTDSPCTDLCGMDRRTGWCRGCGRTAAEIRSWRKMQPGSRKMVLKELKRRLQRLRDQGRVQDDKGSILNQNESSNVDLNSSRRGAGARRTAA